MDQVGLGQAKAIEIEVENEEEALPPSSSGSPYPIPVGPAFALPPWYLSRGSPSPQLESKQEGWYHLYGQSILSNHERTQRRKVVRLNYQ